MEQGRHELALRRLGRVLIAEFHGQLEQATKPQGVVLAGDTALPLHQICGLVVVGCRPCVEAL